MRFKAVLCAVFFVVILSGSHSVHAAVVAARVDVEPFWIGNVRFVAARAFFEQMGFAVRWDNDSRSVSAQADGVVVVFGIGSDTLLHNGAAHRMRAPARIINDTTYVPLDCVAYALGLVPLWENNAVYLLNPREYAPYAFGTWDGRRYTNPWLGLRIDLPDAWTLASPERVAYLTADGHAFLGADADAQPPLAVDMFIYCEITGASVGIYVLNARDMPPHEHMAHIAHDLAQYGYTVHPFEDNQTVIGTHLWRYIDYSHPELGRVVGFRKFVLVRGDIEVHIVVGYLEFFRPLGDILPMLATIMPLL